MRRMKHFLIAALLLLAACTNARHSPPGALQGISPGTIESVEPVELRDPAPAQPEDGGDDDAAPEYGDRLIVRLNDGRTVYLVYTGPRHFHNGQVVRVHVSNSSIFIV
jgi:hypothetical protein